MNDSLLKAYFKRINIREMHQPTLQTLAELQYAHIATFPFENLNPLLGIPVDLNVESLYRKFVDDKRGGYCYEQNLLFLNVLESLNFNVRPLTGRVIHPEKILARTHMLLLIDMDDTQYICDVGFGGATPMVPLLLNNDKEQASIHAKYRVVKNEKDGYLLQLIRKNEQRDLYTFDLQEQYFSDFVTANWYTSTYPEGKFVNHLFMARADRKARYTLSDTRLSVYYPDKESDISELTTPGMFIEVFKSIFKIEVHNLPGLENKLAEVISKSMQNKEIV